jgi:hypothetical protein
LVRQLLRFIRNNDRTAADPFVAGGLGEALKIFAK